MRRDHQLAVLAASLIALAIGIYILVEPARLTQATTYLLNTQIADGQIVYAKNCAVRHNAAGQDLGSTSALNTVGVRQMDYDTLFKTVSHGRYNTAMPAWSTEDGGPLNDAAIEAVIAIRRRRARHTPRAALNVQTFFDKVTSDQAMMQIVSAGVPGTAMPAWDDRLSVSEIEAIVA